MLSFSAVWWRHNLREAFGGVWVAVSTAGVVAPLWTQQVDVWVFARRPPM